MAAPNLFEVSGSPESHFSGGERRSQLQIAGRHADVYESLYREADPSGSGVVSAAGAAGILKRSGLPNAVLAKIWDVADDPKTGTLDKHAFFVALKLIALAQAGQDVALSALRMDSAAPVIEGHWAGGMGGVGGGPPPRPPSVQSSAGHGSALPSPQHSAPPSHGSDWAIRDQDRTKYEAIFESLGPVEGKLLGEQVRPVLLNSGLPQITLGRIWALSDIDQDGRLDREEMCVALHLVYRALENNPVPSSLPANLIPPGKRGLNQRRSSTASGPDESRSRSGSVAGFNPNGPQYQQRGYGASGPTRSSTTTPVPMQMGALPDRLGDSIGSGLDSVGASPSHRPPPPATAPGPSADSAWPIDVEKYRQLFLQLDTNQDGLVNGGDVRGVLMNSGLPQPALAHIWSLVDIRQTGMLNAEQFALTLHLIEDKSQRGRDPPPKLPPNLIPPSMREQPHENGDGSVDNSQIAAVQTELDQIHAEMRNLESQTVEVEAGMAVKQAEVKNLEIELHTLESTVRQLERQQGEAGRRLANLDAQKEALERTLADLNSKLGLDEAEIASAKHELENTTLSAAELEDSLNKKRESLAGLREEEGRMEVKLQMEKANLDTVAQQHGTTESSIRQVESNKRALETSTSTMQETLAKLEAMLADPSAPIPEYLLLTPDKPNLNSFIPAPGAENKWKQSGYQGNTWAQKPSPSTAGPGKPARPPPPSSASSQPQQLYVCTVSFVSDRPPMPIPILGPVLDQVPGEVGATTSADPFSKGDAFGSGADPFGGGGAVEDPFAGEDPFAANTNGGDPFGGGSEDPFVSSNGSADPFAASGDKPKKPPPPRPQPPKSRSNTPAEEADPFGAEPADPFGAPAAASDGFGNFADFGNFS